MAGHFKQVCSCGAVIMQCRCFDLNKTTTVVKNGCAACIEKLQKAGEKR